AANPGAEHYAGVPNGGTFLMVYSKSMLYQGGASNQVVADFALPGKVCCSCDSTEDVLQPLIAVTDEITITTTELATYAETGLAIDVLANDYYASNPSHRPGDAKIEIFNPPWDYPNTGTIKVVSGNEKIGKMKREILLEKEEKVVEIKGSNFIVVYENPM